MYVRQLDRSTVATAKLQMNIWLALALPMMAQKENSSHRQCAQPLFFFVFLTHFFFWRALELWCIGAVLALSTLASFWISTAKRNGYRNPISFGS